MYAEENIEGYIPITRKDGARYFWLRVRGDSMNAAGISENEMCIRDSFRDDHAIPRFGRFRFRKRLRFTGRSRFRGGGHFLRLRGCLLYTSRCV